jgi:alpha-galactosidase
MVAALALFLLSCHDQVNNRILLQDGWKFRTGDDLSWATPGLNDTSWAPISVGQLSEPAVFDKYDGYGWYRDNVFIPASLKDAPHVGDSLIFFLGKIDDCDQVYLNGMLLGQNTKVAPPGAANDSNFSKQGGLWQKERKYVLPVTDKRIRWGQPNALAVRVFDQFGGGGIYGKTPYIGMMDLNEYIVFDLNRFYTLDKKDSLEKRFLVRNTSPTPTPYEGRLLIHVRDRETQTNIFDWETPIRLSPGDSTLIPVTLPVSTDSLDVRVSFLDTHGPMTAVDSITIPYALAQH